MARPEPERGKVGLKASCKIDLGRTALTGSWSGQAAELIGREGTSDLHLECEPATPAVQSRERNSLIKRMPPEGKASRLVEIEARLVADEARRTRVLRAWGPLYFITGRSRNADEKAGPWGLWAARIIETVAALKAEDLISRLDDINSGGRDTPKSRAADYAIKVYRLATDGNAQGVVKAVADGMREGSPTFKSPSLRRHVAEMLRRRIMLGVFRAEWRHFRLAELERELERFRTPEPKVPTA